MLSTLCPYRLKFGSKCLIFEFKILNNLHAFKYAVLICLFISAFPCVPECPGMPCAGEDSIYILHTF